MPFTTSSPQIDGAARNKAFLAVWADLGSPEPPKQYRTHDISFGAQEYRRFVLDPLLQRLGGGRTMYMDKVSRWAWAHKNLQAARRSVTNKMQHEERMLEGARLAYATRVPVGGLRTSFAPPVGRHHPTMGYAGASSSPAPIPRFQSTYPHQHARIGAAETSHYGALPFAPVYIKQEQDGHNMSQGLPPAEQQLPPVMKRESASSLSRDVTPFIKQEPGVGSNFKRIKEEQEQNGHSMPQGFASVEQETVPVMKLESTSSFGSELPRFIKNEPGVGSDFKRIKEEHH